LIAPPPPPVQEMKLPQLETPKPKNKMKTFNWTKLPVNKIFGKNNIWTKVAKTFEKEKATPIGNLALLYFLLIKKHLISQRMLKLNVLFQKSKTNG
jgi:hypothetical protein